MHTFLPVRLGHLLTSPSSRLKYCPQKKRPLLRAGGLKSARHYIDEIYKLSTSVYPSPLGTLPAFFWKISTSIPTRRRFKNIFAFRCSHSYIWWSTPFCTFSQISLHLLLIFSSSLQSTSKFHFRSEHWYGKISLYFNEAFFLTSFIERSTIWLHYMRTRGASITNIFIILISPSRSNNMEEHFHKRSCCKLPLRHNLMTLLFLYKNTWRYHYLLKWYRRTSQSDHSFVLKELDHNAWVNPP